MCFGNERSCMRMTFPKQRLFRCSNERCQNTYMVTDQVACTKTELRTDVWRGKSGKALASESNSRSGDGIKSNCLLLVLRMDIGVNLFALVGCAPGGQGGLNVNNNGYDNENNGVGGCRKSCLLSLAEDLKKSSVRTSSAVDRFDPAADHFSESPEGWFAGPGIAQIYRVRVLS